MEIKAADVAKLRKMTGAGMMDCKKRLPKPTAISTAHRTSSAKKVNSSPANAPTAKLPKAWSPPA